MLSGILSRASTFVTCTLNYTAPLSGPVIGQFLKISLQNQDGTTTTAQVNFDSDISQPKACLTRMKATTINRNIST